jgi:hypothetical protein
MRKNPAAVALGRRGGKRHGELLRSGAIPVSGAAVGVPAKCKRCGKPYDSGRKAAACCRVKRS